MMQPPRSLEPFSHRVRHGFSLLELLVALVIVGVLAALFLGGSQKVRAAAQRAACANNLRQIGLAAHQYHDAHRHFPSGCAADVPGEPFPYMTWMTRLLPNLGEQPVWEEAVRGYSSHAFFNQSPPHTAFSRSMRVFSCPADSRTATPGRVADMPGFEVGFTSYLGSAGTNLFRQDGILFLGSTVRLGDITDGASGTIFAAERPPSADGRYGWWYAGWGQNRDGSADSVLGVRERNFGFDGPGCLPGPYSFSAGRLDNQCDALHFWSLHSGGANVAFVDGSVRFLSYAADAVLPALATRSGGEISAIPD